MSEFPELINKLVAMAERGELQPDPVLQGVIDRQQRKTEEEKALDQLGLLFLVSLLGEDKVSKMIGDF